MATGDDLRRLALAMDGVTAAPHFDRTAFRVRRSFITLASDGLSANFRFSPEEQTFQCLLRPEAFTPIANAWGQQGWTIGTLAAIDVDALKQALALAYAHAAKPSPRRRRST